MKTTATGGGGIQVRGQNGIGRGGCGGQGSNPFSFRVCSINGMCPAHGGHLWRDCFVLTLLTTVRTSLSVVRDALFPGSSYKAFLWTATAGYADDH